MLFHALFNFPAANALTAYANLKTIIHTLIWFNKGSGHV